MIELSIPIISNQTKPAFIADMNTNNLLTKPPNGGIPARDKTATKNTKESIWHGMLTDN